MNTSKVVLLSATFLLVGMIIGQFIELGAPVTREFQWMSITKENISYSYTTAALMESEISLPNIDRIEARAKFVENPIDITDASIGYIVEVTVDPLDIESIPDKYKEERRISDSFTIRAIEEVSYSVSFTLILKDIDGFERERMSGPNHYIRSGQVNEFQELVKSDSAFILTNRITDIALIMNILECETCRS